MRYKVKKIKDKKDMEWKNSKQTKLYWSLDYLYFAQINLCEIIIFFIILISPVDGRGDIIYTRQSMANNDTNNMHFIQPQFALMMLDAGRSVSSDHHHHHGEWGVFHLFIFSLFFINKNEYATGMISQTPNSPYSFKSSESKPTWCLNIWLHVYDDTNDPGILSSS